MKNHHLDKAMTTLELLADAVAKEGGLTDEIKQSIQNTLLILAENRLIDRFEGLDREELDFDRGVAMILEAIENAENELSDPVDRVEIYLNVGDNLYNMGRWDDARSYYDRAMKISDTSNFPYGRAKAFQKLGRLKRRLGRWHQARQALNRAAAMFKTLQRPVDEAETLLQIGNIEFEQGVYDHATRRFYRALNLCKDLDTDAMKADINLSLGVVHQVRGRITQAIKYYQESLNYYTSIGDERHMGHTYLHLGVSHREYGAWARSGMSLEMSLELARKNKDFSLIGIVYLRRAETQIQLSDTSMAIMYARRAMRLFIRLGDPLGQADAHRIYGQAAAMRRAWNQARDYLTESLKLQQKYKSPLGEAETLEAWGQLHEQLEDPAGAMNYFERALTIYRDLGAENDEHRVRELIAQTHKNVLI